MIAAAGGTGQFVVQLAKAAGAHVIALCGSAQKAAMLQGLGADRVINYKTDNLDAILKQEYPKVSISLSSIVNVVIQLAKAADAHVSALCGSVQEAAMLQSLGADKSHQLQD